ncbi:MAG: radical SAM protein [Ignavibacteriales bacterium]
MTATTVFSKCYLILTEDCNLRCKYCYENANRCTKRYMSFDTAKMSADFLFDNALKHGVKSLKWTFFGGEPLLNLDVMISFFRYVVDKSKINNIKSNFSLVTNGTIYNKQFEEFILEWYKATKQVSIQVSTDGIPEVQDENRITINSKPTSRIVLENILKIKTLFKKNKIDISSLHTHAVVTKAAIPKVFSSYKYFKHLGIINDISFELLHEEDWDENDISIYIDQLSQIADYVYKECVSSCSLKPYENAKGLIAMKTDKAHENTCEAGKTVCAINPKGDIYPCDKAYFSSSNFIIGNIFEGVIDNSNRELFLKACRNDMHVGNVSCGTCDNTMCKICMVLNYEKYNDILKCNPLACLMYKAKWKFINQTKKKFDKLAYKLDYNSCSETVFYKTKN